jgi:hypothetical protein
LPYSAVLTVLDCQIGRMPRTYIRISVSNRLAQFGAISSRAVRNWAQFGAISSRAVRKSKNPV